MLNGNKDKVKFMYVLIRSKDRTGDSIGHFKSYDNVENKSRSEQVYVSERSQ